MFFHQLDIWSEQSFQTDPDLPPGWKKITDMAGIYYWHIPTGTTQWERPATRPAPPGQTDSLALSDHTASTPRKHSLGSLSPSPTPDHEVRHRRTNTHFRFHTLCLCFNCLLIVARLTDVPIKLNHHKMIKDFFCGSGSGCGQTHIKA